MGVGAQDVLGRVAASIGDLESVAPEFQAVVDVPKGGVLRPVGLVSHGLVEIYQALFQVAERLL